MSDDHLPTAPMTRPCRSRRNAVTDQLKIVAKPLEQICKIVGDIFGFSLCVPKTLFELMS